MGKRNVKKVIVQKSGLAPEAVGCVRLTMIDNTNLYIENHSNISEYSMKRVGVYAGPFYITVEGSELELESFGQENVAIKGEIASIKYEIAQRG
ncbi:MAG: YabP/YqfC family sporulation protein [Burkholderiales bacterium]